MRKIDTRFCHRLDEVDVGVGHRIKCTLAVVAGLRECVRRTILPSRRKALNWIWKRIVLRFAIVVTHADRSAVRVTVRRCAAVRAGHIGVCLDDAAVQVVIQDQVVAARADVTDAQCRAVSQLTLILDVELLNVRRCCQFDSKNADVLRVVEIDARNVAERQRSGRQTQIKRTVQARPESVMRTPSP